MQDTKAQARFDILIVGGGSAGWITANILNATLNNDSPSRFNITVIESPDIPKIGVGEATVPSIRRTLQTIGLPESLFMSRCEATFKNAIRFENWNINETYDHPFDRRKRPDTDEQVRAWFSSKDAVDFDKSFSLLSNICDRNLCPKSPDWPEYSSTFPYAYHLDAVLFAKLLCEWGIERGIVHRLGNVTQVDRSDDGAISRIGTDRGEFYSADLFIDCTGFRAKLISEALNVPQQNYNQYLLCDSAITLRVPYSTFKPQALRPYTRSHALSAGWCWDINLTSRRGLGYVYSSDFIDKEQAERELKAFEGEHAQTLEVNQIRFQSVKKDVSWYENCVAIGLSDGFLEPLESSGLYMIEHAAHALTELIPDYLKQRNAARALFNKLTSDLYQEVLEFINLHYLTAKRRDTEFWRAATANSAICPSLRNRFYLWKHRGPSDLDFSSRMTLFSSESYEYILFGSRHSQPDVGSSKTYVNAQVNQMVEKCAAKFPSMDDWVETSI